MADFTKEEVLALASVVAPTSGYRSVIVSPKNASIIAELLRAHAEAMSAVPVAVNVLQRIRDIANGRDQLDGFPRSADEKQRRLAEIVAVIDAAPPAIAPAEPVAVKTLEWAKHESADLWRAATIIGTYYVYGMPDAIGWKFEPDSPNVARVDFIPIDSVAGGWGQAQAHFDDCIRSALVSPPAPVAEAGAVVTPEGLRKALNLAVALLAPHEPGDSRAVSDEFVALASVACDCANADAWRIIDEALARMLAEPPPAREIGEDR